MKPAIGLLLLCMLVVGYVGMTNWGWVGCSSADFERLEGRVAELERQDKGSASALEDEELGRGSEGTYTKELYQGSVSNLTRKNLFLNVQRVRFGGDRVEIIESKKISPKGKISISLSEGTHHFTVKDIDGRPLYLSTSDPVSEPAPYTYGLFIEPEKGWRITIGDYAFEFSQGSESDRVHNQEPVRPTVVRPTVVPDSEFEAVFPETEEPVAPQEEGATQMRATREPTETPTDNELPEDYDPVDHIGKWDLNRMRARQDTLNVDPDNTRTDTTGTSENVVLQPETN